MSTATRVTNWTRTWTDNEGVSRDYRLPVQIDQYGGDASLWRVDPPLDGHTHILICDRGALLHDNGLSTVLDLFSGGQSPTVVPAVVEVFGANPDGSVDSMTTLREPISLNRTYDGIDLVQILATLGYQEPQ